MISVIRLIGLAMLGFVSSLTQAADLPCDLAITLQEPSQLTHELGKPPPLWQLVVKNEGFAECPMDVRFMVYRSPGTSMSIVREPILPGMVQVRNSTYGPLRPDQQTTFKIRDTRSLVEGDYTYQVALENRYVDSNASNDSPIWHVTYQAPPPPPPVSTQNDGDCDLALTLQGPARQTLEIGKPPAIWKMQVKNVGQGVCPSNIGLIAFRSPGPVMSGNREQVLPSMMPVNRGRPLAPNEESELPLRDIRPHGDGEFTYQVQLMNRAADANDSNDAPVWHVTYQAPQSQQQSAANQNAGGSGGLCDLEVGFQGSQNQIAEMDKPPAIWKLKLKNKGAEPCPPEMSLMVHRAVGPSMAGGREAILPSPRLINRGRPLVPNEQSELSLRDLRPHGAGPHSYQVELLNRGPDSNSSNDAPVWHVTYQAPQSQQQSASNQGASAPGAPSNQSGSGACDIAVSLQGAKNQTLEMGAPARWRLAVENVGAEMCPQGQSLRLVRYEGRQTKGEAQVVEASKYLKILGQPLVPGEKVSLMLKDNQAYREGPHSYQVKLLNRGPDSNSSNDAPVWHVTYQAPQSQQQSASNQGASAPGAPSNQNGSGACDIAVSLQGAKNQTLEMGASATWRLAVENVGAEMCPQGQSLRLVRYEGRQTKGEAQVVEASKNLKILGQPLAPREKVSLMLKDNQSHGAGQYTYQVVLMNPGPDSNRSNDGPVWRVAYKETPQKVSGSHSSNSPASAAKPSSNNKAAAAQRSQMGNTRKESSKPSYQQPRSGTAAGSKTQASKRPTVVPAPATRSRPAPPQKQSASPGQPIRPSRPPGVAAPARAAPAQPGSAKPVVSRPQPAPRATMAPVTRSQSPTFQRPQLRPMPTITPPGRK